MTEPIQVGDRVTWRSVRADRKGNRQRVGVVLKLGGDSLNLWAGVQPDKGQGRYQILGLRRLRKVEVQP